MSIQLYQNQTTKFVYKFSVLKCANTPQLYTIDTNFYNCSINIGSIPLLSTPDMHQSHDLLVCHITGINSSFNSSLSTLRFSNLISPT